ncbi:SDR family oxidoreductase [Brucella sp. H1_1004]|uniref:SDR family NAD(P)-dependent oxidoreductase n=1 Tax=Brucella sp. H1_1004 TaxID=3110109 RepID=UPI0039B4C825
MSGFAVVTGGSTGIGRHLVLAFAEAGYAVAFSFRGDEEPSNTLVEEVEAAGGQALGIECDVGSAAEVDAFFDEVCSWYGDAPDVLVNNAGIQVWASLLELSEDDWDDVIRTNMKGCFLNTQAAARRMVDVGKAGSIINIGSGCNKLAFPNLVSYTASKGGIEQFTKVSAVELGPKGIRVNCVAPGAILNECTMQEQPDYAPSWSRITPLRRVGSAEDISGPVLFLASDAAGFVTGQTLWVDGGVFSQANWAYDR